MLESLGAKFSENSFPHVLNANQTVVIFRQYFKTFDSNNLTSALNVLFLKTKAAVYFITFFFNMLVFIHFLVRIGSDRNLLYFFKTANLMLVNFETVLGGKK